MYDNTDLAKQKLHGTICYYDGRAVMVKEITYNYGKDDPNHEKPPAIGARIFHIDGSKPGAFVVSLDDPKFQFMEYNTGYINFSGYALWYYRVPHRQWKQGLHRSQFQMRDYSKLMDYHDFDNFGSNEFTAAMLENRYPSFKEALATLENPNYLKMAFHKDFALYRDKMRKDFMIEWKGFPAAFQYKDFDDPNVIKFRCAPEMGYLKESIQEMGIKVS